MTVRPTSYIVLPDAPIPQQLNDIFAILADRLDRLEGIRGTTTTDSNIVTNGTPYVSMAFHSQDIVTPGAGTDPGRDTSSGLLEFDGSGTEVISGAAMLPRQWREGSVVSPCVHWSKTTSATGTVLWQWRYKYADMGKGVTSFTDWLAAIEVVSGGNAADRHARADLPDFTLGTETGSVLLWQLRRLGGSDTYGADAQLYAFALNLQIDRIGSTTEFSK